MSNQEILTKAIDKAIAGGWKMFFDGILHFDDYVDMRGIDVGSDKKRTVYWCNWRPNSHPSTELQHWECDIEKIIFNHDFAKALWGDEEREPELGFITKQGWKGYLQQMVLAEDRIKYLGDNI